VSAVSAAASAQAARFPARRLGVLVSGRGSNLQALIDAIADRRLDATIAVVISNREEAAGLARAREAGIDASITVVAVARRRATARWRRLLPTSTWCAWRFMRRTP
jgi:precorrin-6B methylase 2